MLYLITAVIGLFFISGALLSLASREGSASGIINGRLSPCPQTPNCVCSEAPRQPGYVEPLAFHGDAAQAWSQAQAAVRDTGGRVIQAGSDYLAATYSSRLFRFVDDVELRLDRDGKRIHVRSASRVGHSDLGANRERVARIRQRFAEPPGR